MSLERISTLPFYSSLAGCGSPIESHFAVMACLLRLQACKLKPMYAQNPVPPDPTGSNPPPGDQVPSPGDPVIGKVELPPAAKTVLTGTKTERETTLEAELQTERNSHAKTAEEKKKRELRIAELEDELHRLKSPPAPKKKAGLLDLNEFFDE